MRIGYDPLLELAGQAGRRTDFEGRLKVHTASSVLNIATDRANEFEHGLREYELPTHRDLYARGLLVMSLLAHQLSQPFVFGGDTILNVGP